MSALLGGADLGALLVELAEVLPPLAVERRPGVAEPLPELVLAVPVEAMLALHALPVLEELAQPVPGDLPADPVGLRSGDRLRLLDQRRPLGEPPLARLPRRAARSPPCAPGRAGSAPPAGSRARRGHRRRWRSGRTPAAAAPRSRPATRSRARRRSAARGATPGRRARSTCGRSRPAPPPASRPGRSRRRVRRRPPVPRRCRPRRPGPTRCRSRPRSLRSSAAPPGHQPRRARRWSTRSRPPAPACRRYRPGRHRPRPSGRRRARR